MNSTFPGKKNPTHHKAKPSWKLKFIPCLFGSVIIVTELQRLDVWKYNTMDVGLCHKHLLQQLSANKCTSIKQTHSIYFTHRLNVLGFLCLQAPKAWARGFQVKPTTPHHFGFPKLSCCPSLHVLYSQQVMESKMRGQNNFFPALLGHGR